MLFICNICKKSGRSVLHCPDLFVFIHSCSQISTGDTVRADLDFLRCTFGDNPSAMNAAARPHVNAVVRIPDDIKEEPEQIRFASCIFCSGFPIAFSYLSDPGSAVRSGTMSGFRLPKAL